MFTQVRHVHTRVVEKIKTQILYSVMFFFPENHAFYEIIWKYAIEPGRPQMTIGRMRIACWIRVHKATDTHSGCVILIAFHCNNGSTYAPQCYVIRMLPVCVLLGAHCCLFLEFFFHSVYQRHIFKRPLDQVCRQEGASGCNTPTANLDAPTRNLQSVRQSCWLAR